MVKFIVGAVFVMLASCAPTYDLTDRSGNVFIIENPVVETKGDWEYRTGNVVRELQVSDVVSLSIPTAEPKIFDGRVFYPATLALEDTVSVPPSGFICIEGELKADNAGRKISIHLSNVKDLKLRKKEKKKEAEPPQEAEQPQEGTGN